MNSTMKWIAGATLVFVGTTACGGSAPAPAPDEQEEATEDIQESAAAPPAEPVAPEAPAGTWQVRESTNPLDDSRTVVASLEAVEGVGGFGSEPITLMARCQSNTTEVYVNWHEFLGDDDLQNVQSTRKRVTYRFPPAEAQTELWGVSTDNDATFVRQTIPFLRTLGTSDRLVMQTTPYGENPKLAQFDLTGARAALDPIAETCNWIIDPAELAEQGEREARERQARERAQEAERERILNDLIGTPFPAGDVSSIGRVGELTSAGGGLPEHVRRAYFEAGFSVARVARARNTEEEIVCSRGEWTDDGIMLRDCSLR